MPTINLNKEWDFIIAETHREKPRKTNVLKRESLFVLQILIKNRTRRLKTQGDFFEKKLLWLEKFSFSKTALKPLEIFSQGV